MGKSVKKLDKKRRIGGNFWTKNYRESWSYLRDSRNFIFIIIFIFLIFALFGFLITPNPDIEKMILEVIKELMKKTEGMSTWQLIEFILQNNFQTSLVGMFSGVMFGVFSLVTTIINGYVLGYVAQISVKEAGIGVLWRLFPHGIFELPAVFISLGLGLKLGMYFLYSKEKSRSFAYYVVSIVSFMLLSGIVLLLYSALFNNELSSEVMNGAISFNYPLFLSGLLLILFIGIFYFCSFMLHENDRKLFFKWIADSAKVFVFIIIPLLIIAAVIEGCLIALVG